ncbi:MAG: pyridine nucleotide-disulfide oxidoreductase [Proteobacteria bacterium]|nr:pyridine nucleotide-disulfide oxidoreductase [Pseudomonadota bacterium]
MTRLVLLGSGPLHLRWLRALARARARAPAGPAPADLEVCWVVPFAERLHAPMLPALVAGRCSVAQASIALRPLAEAARVALVESPVLAVDAAARRVTLGNGDVIEADAVSADADPVVDRDAIPGAREHGLFLRPLEHFARLLEPLLALAAERVLDVVVVGGDLAAVELALALQQRLAGGGEERARVALVSGGPAPLLGQPSTGVDRLRPALEVDRVRRTLVRQRITVFPDACARIEAGMLHLASGARLACDAPLIADGGAPPPWLVASGWQAVDHGRYAIGDLPPLPSLPPWPASPPAAAPRLQWLITGDGGAIAWHGAPAWQGRWLGGWKERAERRAVARLARP